MLNIAIMKTLKHLLTALLLMVATVAMAYDFEVDGIYYNITNATNKTVEMVAPPYGKYTGNVIIPACIEYNGEKYDVVAIGGNAFYFCYDLTSITIPSSIIRIGGGAFTNCTGLTTVNINDIAAWCQIEFVDYYSTPFNFAEKMYLNGELLVNLVIPDGVKEIKQYAFYKNKNIAGVVIPNSVIGIGYKAFLGCSGIESVIIGNCVEKIGDYAFHGCSKMSDLSIGTQVKNIGESAFQSCNNLQRINIESLESWFNISFSDRTANPVYYAKDIYLDNELVTNIVVPMSVTRINDYAFINCSQLKNIDISGSVEVVGSYAFENCVGLTSIIIPNSVTSIGNYAFNKCSNLKTIINLSNLTFQAKSTNNGYIAYYAENVINAKNGSIVNDFVFSSENKVHTLVTYLGTEDELELPKDYNGENYHIESYAFDNNGLISMVKIPNSVLSIGNYAFRNCQNLQLLYIGSSIERISNYAFAGCYNIMDIYNFSTKAITCEKEIFSTDVYNNATLYVPKGRVQAYSKTTPWSEFYIEEIKPFTITYMVDGKVYRTQTIDCGADIPTIEEPVKQGYTFSGWSEIPATMPAEDIIITGSFTVNTYAVTYIVDGEVYAIDSIAYGCEIVLRDEPVKEGHTFSGWSEIPATMSDEDITITGSFTVNTYVVTYIVDGTVYVTDSVVYGAEIVPRDEPTREGHTFSGWSEIPATMPAANITIMGSFAVNSYTVTFMIDGEVYETMSVEFGAEIELPTPPEKEGHTFSGWLGVPDTMPAEDIVIEGKFIADDTGINDVKNESSNVRTVYDLQGRKVDNPTNGIYIVNGKKVFVK